ncbi:MAG TPA: GNAT family N-acetyltransferase [Vitreimonas sp.]|nr:GNAT family N-acetyltransferase [Vitreimonas sp.]
MQVHVHTDPTIFTTQAEEYTALLTSADNPAFFMLPEYQAVWWHHLGEGELEVLEFRSDKGTLVGLAPLYNHNGTYRLVGAVDVSDYLDIIVTSAHKAEVYQALINYFHAKDAWEQLKLESLAHSSPTLTELPALAAAQGWQTEQKQQDVCPVLALPANWEEYFSSLDLTVQKNFKRLLRSIGEEDEITYSVITSDNEIEAAMNDFILLHKQSGEEKKLFWDEKKEAFFKELGKTLLTAGYLKLFFLSVNDDRAAALMIFDWHNLYLLYNSGFNAYRYGHMGVGNALILHTIQQAIKEKKGIYDFMRGNESYKFQFRAQPQNIFDLFITK